MQIDIFSDVVCPFCYLGKRHLELALEQFPHADQVTVAWHSFQLDPSAPATSELRTTQMLSEKYGISPEQAAASQQQLTKSAADVGLEYHLDTTTVANTLDAHRLIHLAAVAGRATPMVEALMAAYFTDGAAIGDHDVLRGLADQVGLDSARVDEVLAGAEFTAEVDADQQLARQLGVQGVPFFVFDQTMAVSGAQPPEVLLDALGQAWEKRAG